MAIKQKEIPTFVLSFKTMLKLQLSIAVALQLIIISYNHLTGYSAVQSFGHFAFKLIYSSALTTIAGLLISYPDLYVVQILNNKFPWKGNVFPRIILQLSVTIFLAIVVASLLTFTAHLINPYIEPVIPVLIKNIQIAVLVNAMMMLILEAWVYYDESTKSKLKAGILEKELSQMKYELLKKQINPHFMFNSLNVLSGLIDQDTKKAQQFIDEFALIYRYVLETIEKTVVPLNEELDFIRSYLYLQEIRFGDALKVEIDIQAEKLPLFLPPLSIQVAVENALKHNVVNDENPLHIKIFNENGFIVVENNVQRKFSQQNSTGLGQKNVEKRFALVSDKIPQFQLKKDVYLAKYPLLKLEDYENSDC